MKYTKDIQIKFIDDELSAISDKYLSIIKKPATILMNEGELFVSQFIKVDEQGRTILKMRNSRGLPRKGDYFCSVLLIGEMCKFKNWGNISWADLRKHYQRQFSEVVCTWQGKASDSDFSLVGVKGMTIEMAKLLEPNCILVLGPQEPPIAYYQNLISTIRSEKKGSEIFSLLEFQDGLNRWAPKPLTSSESNADFFINYLQNNDEIIVQGPPGTGKTYKMAELISSLCKESSVLVTALTNRALMEVAGKDSLKDLLNNKRIHKTKLTSDESKELPMLQNIEGKDIYCQKGNLTLATFYMSSGWINTIEDIPPFDYVIMDEASQAFYGMVVLIKKIGKKVIWIGDQNQLPPVINMNVDIAYAKNYLPLAEGFSTICKNFSYPSFLLSDTYRLSERAAQFTGLFYNNSLRSVADKNKSSSIASLGNDGGPSIVNVPMERGDKSPRNAIDKCLEIVKKIVVTESKIEIAILSKFRTTVKALQSSFVNYSVELPNLLIDTVERVQGLTCDVCIYLIPNYMTHMSLDKALFNVATSRATRNTIIICDQHLLETPNMASEVRLYLENITNVEFTSDSIADSCKSVPSGIKVIGQIDLSKFERPKKELSDTKRNYYVIDTNVFVNCPDIISRINKQYPIILSAKVTDELDKMKIKLDAQGKQNAERALRNLNNECSHEIIYEFADTSLLPEDFDKKSPDNMILSVALKYKNDNPIMLTSDNGLQLKSKILGIKTLSLRDFLKR